MKTPIFTLLIFALSIMVSAQAPERFQYQTVVRDNAGQPIANQNVSFRINIHEGSAGGTVVYSETHTLSTNDFGLVNLQIGGGAPVSGTMGAIDWGSNEYHLETELDASGGSSYISMGTSQLLSVPYALNSAKASDMALNDLTDAQGSPSNGEVLKWNGTVWAPAADNAGSSPWTASGSNIHFNTGNVGIGLTTPVNTFSVLQPLGTLNTARFESLDHPAGKDLLELIVPITASSSSQFIEFQTGSTIVAAVNADGSAEFSKVTVDEDLNATTSPDKGTVYANGLPIAYGYISSGTTTATLVTDYGVAGVTKPAATTGEYRIVLNNTIVGEPVIIATSYNGTPGDEIATANKVSATEIEINIADGSGTALNSNFYFIVFGSVL